MFYLIELIKMGRIRKLFWLSGGLFISILLGCQPEPPEVPTYTRVHPGTHMGDLHAYLDAYRMTYDIPALAAAVITADSIVAIGVAGERVAHQALAAELDDTFHIGSCTKSMTATLAAILIEEGLLSWETTLGDVYSESLPAMHLDWHNVTLQQLLTNSAGFAGDMQEAYPELWDAFSTTFRSFEPSPPEQRRFMLEHVLQRPPSTSPGTTYTYSNIGFSVAGAMLESVTGKPFEALMRERLFEPLGMISGGFGAPGTPGSNDQPWGHKRDGTPVTPGWEADNAPMLSPAGRVHISVHDWAKYIQFHLSGWREGNALLSHEQFERLYTPFLGDDVAYAMGWVVSDEAGPDVRTLLHTGSNTVWYSMAWMALERDFAVVVVGNKGGTRDAIDATLWQLVVDHVQRRAMQSG